MPRTSVTNLPLSRSAIRSRTDANRSIIFYEHNGATHVIITLDVSNAFNSISRLQGLLSIAQSLPGIYTHANCTYRRTNALWMEGPDETMREPIKGREGSIQGAVDGGTFFNMAMNHVLKEANAVLEPGRDEALVATADDIVGCD